MKKDYESTKKLDADGDKSFSCPYATQVYIHHVNAWDAKGPTYARSLLSEDIALDQARGKVNSQDFCLSIDSHMDFEPHFDEALVDMWDMIHNEYAVLSTYVAGTEQLGVNLGGVHEVPHLCMVKFTSSVRTHATKMAQNLSRPKLTNAVYGAGLAFSKCHAELKVRLSASNSSIQHWTQSGITLQISIDKGSHCFFFSPCFFFFSIFQIGASGPAHSLRIRWRRIQPWSTVLYAWL